MNILGIDGGGTQTVCILIDDAGQILGRGVSGPSNYQSVGLEVAGLSIQSAIAQAVPDSSLPIHGICLGLAGVGRPADQEIIRALLTQLQTPEHLGNTIHWSVHPQGVVICGDSQVALMGGVGHAVGIVVIAGTGSHIFGQNAHGHTQRVGGWGYLLGDEGSGYDIAIQGLKAALRAFDGRGEPTQLIEQFEQHLGLNTIESLVEVVYRRGWKTPDLAALAPIVDQVAAAGDVVANQIIDQAVAELVLGVKVVIQGLFRPGESLEIVTMGGVWQGVANLRGRFIDRLQAQTPVAQVIWPRHEPAYGAGLLSLQALKQFIDTR